MSNHGAAAIRPATIKFQDIELSIIDRDGVPWLTGPDIARALGYARSDKITRLYHRHKDEFTDAMTQTPEMGFSGNLRRKVRIFSPRGAQLIAMLAKTDRAKAFRRWVLDVLEGQGAGRPSARPVVDDADAFRRQVVSEVVTTIMDRIGDQIAAGSVPADRPRTPDKTAMPCLQDGQAVFCIDGRMVIVDTRDYRLSRGDRAVVIRVEDGEFPKIVTILGEPPVKGWFDRCMIYASDVRWHIPVGAVLGRVVWEGDCHG